jgi:3-oxoacyl-[acyl-carrier-protein] synthase-3
VVHILGAGVAYPDVELSDEFLGEIGSDLEPSSRGLLSRLGVVSRRVSLPLDYIEATKNTDALEGRKVATCTPTALGAAAVKQALDRAGVLPEQIGLLIADTATPHQTCPSEAQRIAGSLQLKIPAYDMVGGAGALPLCLETFKNWKPERLPEFVVCVSTNTPSQHVDYSKSSIAAHLFGDAASAIVVSTRTAGKVKLVDSYLRRSSAYRSLFTIDRHLSLSVDALLPANEICQMVTQGIKRLKEKHDVDFGSAKLIGPQLFDGQMVSLAGDLGIEIDAIVSTNQHFGYSIGSSIGAALATAWDGISSGEQVVIIHAGDGLWSGSVLLASD